MEIETLYSIYRQHPLVSTDTRDIRPGSVFFCLKGERFDGNVFAADALEKGAAYVVMDNAAYRVDDRCLLVSDVLETLQQLARYHRQQLKIPVIGITGTNGKTTTKELVTAVLSKKYCVTATKGNLNNHIGVPLTLLAIGPETEIAVVEMGANHPHEIAELCALSQPDFGLITNIGKAHLEGFGSVECIVSTKTALYRAVHQRDGLLFVHADDALLMKESADCRRYTYGTLPDADVQGWLLPGRLQMALRYPDQTDEVDTQLVGDYNFPNVMAALAVGRHFRVDAADAVAAIREYTPGNGRSQILCKGNTRIVLDAYNANPTSMEVAIRNMEQMVAPHKSVVLGDMRELGKESRQEHQKMVDLLLTCSFEKVFLLGEEFGRTSAPENWKYAEMSDLQQALKNYLANCQASILVKGSRGMRMERVLELFDPE